MKYIEALAILIALILEWESLIKVQRIHDCKESSLRANIIVEGYPRGMLFIFFLGAAGYLAFSIYWMFNTILAIQVAATILIAVSTVASLWQSKPVWFRRLDCVISISCLLTVGYYRLPGLF